MLRSGLKKRAGSAVPLRPRRPWRERPRNGSASLTHLPTPGPTRASRNGATWLAIDVAY